ncbi:hypothetical protein ACO0LM_11795 [Undibacterium sp. Di26W]|uniref:hypothetical protein n=1 Tax=Undibacterium sp. Di26W TaxID=3413035 RepID=UPI003BF3C149
MPNTPLLVGTVVSVVTGGVYVQVPDGAQVFARGTGDVGTKVFVRDGVIEGVAPNLSIEVIDV